MQPDDGNAGSDAPTADRILRSNLEMRRPMAPMLPLK
jgi:hypothetical protein